MVSCARARQRPRRGLSHAQVRSDCSSSGTRRGRTSKAARVKRFASVHTRTNSGGSREWLPKKDRLRRCDIGAGKTTADANISAVGPKKGDEVRGENRSVNAGYWWGTYHGTVAESSPYIIYYQCFSEFLGATNHNNHCEINISSIVSREIVEEVRLIHSKVRYG